MVFSICTQPRCRPREAARVLPGQDSRGKGVRAEDIDKKSDMMDYARVVKEAVHYVARIEST